MICKICFRVEFIACQGELMQNGVLTSFTLCNPYCSFAGQVLKLTIEIRLRISMRNIT